MFLNKYIYINILHINRLNFTNNTNASSTHQRKMYSTCFRETAAWLSQKASQSRAIRGFTPASVQFKPVQTATPGLLVTFLTNACTVRVYASVGNFEFVLFLL